VVLEAMRSTVAVRWVLVGAEYAGSEEGRRVMAACGGRGVDVQELPDRKVVELASTDRPRPVVACVRPPVSARQSLRRGRYLMALGVQIPGNLGTLIRSAWAFGLAGVVIGKGSVDPWSPKVVRASAGGVFHVPLLHGPKGRGPATQPAGSVDALTSVNLLCADPHGVPVEAVRESCPPDWVLVVGNETAGLPARLVRRGRAVSIPQVANVDSLNVGVAGSILMYVLSSPSL